ELQGGQVGADRGDEGQRALVDQAPDGRGRVGLGEGANLEEGRRRHRPQGGEAGHPEGGVFLSVAGQDAEGGARNLGVAHRRHQRLGDGAEFRGGVRDEGARQRDLGGGGAGRRRLGGTLLGGQVSWGRGDGGCSTPGQGQDTAAGDPVGQAGRLH